MNNISQLHVAVDFDGTIVEGNNYPRIGKLRPYAKQVLNKMSKHGYYLYLWTCRTGEVLQDAIEFLHQNGIYLDSYNKGPSTGSPKLIADVYIDDAAYPNAGTIDWLEVAKYFGIEVDSED